MPERRDAAVASVEDAAAELPRVLRELAVLVDPTADTDTTAASLAALAAATSKVQTLALVLAFTDLAAAAQVDGAALRGWAEQVADANLTRPPAPPAEPTAGDVG